MGGLFNTPKPPAPPPPVESPDPEDPSRRANQRRAAAMERRQSGVASTVRPEAGGSLGKSTVASTYR